MCRGQKLARLKNAVYLSKRIFSSLNFHMRIVNTAVTYLQKIKNDTLKDAGGVDSTMYALSAIIQYVQWSKIG